ncbi:hypothetical protein K445DRAFT_323132 [Daldinia sp. EC12]|nr:hypothetical protein F4774DRAFT_368414 [Daldinia eschscholtzii]OTB10271.1 hypothetical protein K445DRAFT_323132 [Daldinia sp. EC12]
MSTTTPRSRSPLTPVSTRSSSSSDHVAIQIHSCPCEKCEAHHASYNNSNGSSSSSSSSSSQNSTKAIENNTTRFDVPLIAIPRLFTALLGLATVIRVHTAIDAGWWPWENKVLFSLCWLGLFWNLAHGLCSILGYAYWPSPRRTAGLPPVTLAINGKTIVSFGGPDEDDGVRRRRAKRLQFSIVDILLAGPTLGFLIYSAHIMYPWWGSRYVGLWPPTIGLIASLVSFEFLTAFLQLFQFFEAKVVGVQLTMQDIYDKDESVGRLQL